VLEAAHGKEALKIWHEHRGEIDLLLTDMMMPEGLSGWELAELIHQEKPDLKVIYTSGYSVDLFGHSTELREGVNFLPKPYHPATLAKAIRACLDS
jgi:two-component system, cell cycle sensor histidine kinase and response regulator CckA